MATVYQHGGTWTEPISLEIGFEIGILFDPPYRKNLWASDSIHTASEYKCDHFSNFQPFKSLSSYWCAQM